MHGQHALLLASSLDGVCGWLLLVLLDAAGSDSSCHGTAHVRDVGLHTHIIQKQHLIASCCVLPLYR